MQASLLAIKASVEHLEESYSKQADILGVRHLPWEPSTPLGPRFRATFVCDQAKFLSNVSPPRPSFQAATEDRFNRMVDGLRAAFAEVLILFGNHIVSQAASIDPVADIVSLLPTSSSFLLALLGSRADAARLRAPDP